MAVPAEYIKIELKEAKPTSVILTGTRADATSTSTATITLTPTGGTAITETITMNPGEDEKDYVISGLTPETTYAVAGTGQYDSGGSISSVTTIEDTPKTATISQWEDLANRVKAAGGSPLILTITLGQDDALTWSGATTNEILSAYSAGRNIVVTGFPSVDLQIINVSGNATALVLTSILGKTLIGLTLGSGSQGYWESHEQVNTENLSDRILASGTSAPTTSTVGKVGTLYAYVVSGVGHLAICTDTTGGTYTWQTLI